MLEYRAAYVFLVGITVGRSIDVDSYTKIRRGSALDRQGRLQDLNVATCLPGRKNSRCRPMEYIENVSTVAEGRGYAGWIDKGTRPIRVSERAPVAAVASNSFYETACSLNCTI